MLLSEGRPGVGGFRKSTLALAVRLDWLLRCQRRLEYRPAGGAVGVTLPARYDAELGRNDGPKYDQQQAASILAVLNDLADRRARGEALAITSDGLCRLHEQLLGGPPSDNPTTARGAFRSGGVSIGGGEAVDAAQVPRQVDGLLAWVRSPETDPIGWSPAASALVKATAMHAELLRIHPFADGNGRAARAAEFQVLLAAGVPAPAAHELFNWFNEDRSRYVRALRAADAEGADRFVAYALAGLEEQLRRRINRSLADRPLYRRAVLRAGFSLVELVVVMLLLGILAGIAAPKFFSQTNEAEQAAEDELVRRIRAGIDHYYLETLAAGSPAYPDELDDSTSSCTPDTPCFVKVLKRGVTDESWVKTDDHEYHAASGNSYIYNPKTGEFAES